MKKNYLLTKILIPALMLVSVLVYAGPAEKTIIFVGQYVGGTTDIRPEDQTAIDSISQWVTDVVFLDQGVFNDAPADSLYGDGAEAIGAEGVIISESIGSESVGNFGLRDDYPVPCITMEGVMTNDPESTVKWPLLLEDGGVWGFGSPDDVDVQWKIVEDQHYITEDYTYEQIVDYANAADRGVPYLHGIAPSHLILATAVREEGLGTEDPPYVQEEAIALGYIENPAIMFMNVAYTYLADGAATTDLYNVLHRAVEFVFDAYWIDAVNTLLADEIDLSVSPNPATSDFDISFTIEAGKNVSVNLISVTGGLIGTVYEGLSVAGNNIVNINIANFAPGLYIVELHINNNVAYSKLIIK